MRDHTDLQRMNDLSLAQQAAVRRATFSPSEVKQLRAFSIWEISQFMFAIPADTLRKKLADDPSLPQGAVEDDGRQRWFTLDEINELRRRLTFHGRRLLPPRPKGRAMRVAVSNFKGGVGKTVVTQHLAHAAALDGYRVLCVDFDPQATLTHAMGLHDIRDAQTVWGIICRDLCREADRISGRYDDPDDCPYPAADELPRDVQAIGAQRVQDFIRPTCWSTIDLIPSCANAAFVEFATAQYRALHKAWSFFGCVDRYLAELADDQYDIILFDCPPAIGYQSLNAAFAADILYIPSGPGYWEYNSTTSYLGQLGDALADIAEGFAGLAEDAGLTLPKRFSDIRLLMTRFEAANPLHEAMMDAFRNVFGADLCRNPVEMTRAVEQSGRFQMSVYEQDYRLMTRETWKRARQSFDRAYDEFRATLLQAWATRDGARAPRTAEQERIPA